MSVKNQTTAPIVLRILILVGLLLPGVYAAADEWRFSGVDRIVAISDVHGAYDAMVRTLTNAGVIDDTQSWAAGSTHLVIVGDLLDRGPDSRRVMDLVMRIEGEAVKQGGRVHQLLGNHEVMNLVGDLRYVSDQEYAAFADDESVDEREQWFLHYKASQAERSVDDSVLRAEFNDRAPPGFFAHRRAFREEGVYGAWLLQKPLLIVINNTAFVHGGVSPMVGELGLAGVNGRLTGEMSEYVRQLSVLTDAGIISPLENFNNHALALKSKQPDAQPADAISTVIELNKSDIHSPDGPLWYRGSVGCGPLIESDRLNAALDKIGADRVVIGHTPTVTRRILQRLGGQVIEVDTGMLTSSYRGSGNALLIEGDSMYAINEASGEHLSVGVHPRRVGVRAAGITAADLERLLAHGEIVSQRTDELGRTFVEVAAESGTVAAMFTENPRAKGFSPELAAYRLDRAIGLDMVPVTVARELHGKQGTLQFRAKGASDEASRMLVNRGGSAWCALPQQWAAMYVFDALVYNPGRSPEQMLYSPDNWQLMLVGHDKVFSSKRGRPKYLQNTQLQVGESWRRALAALDDNLLAEQFSDVLDQRRIKALGRRRDELLKQ